MLLDHVVAQKPHPLLVACPEMAAPFAHEQRSSVIFNKIEPVVTPAVLHECFTVEVLLEPFQSIYADNVEIDGELTSVDIVDGLTGVVGACGIVPYATFDDDNSVPS